MRSFAVLLLAAAACGGPFDRRDGALVVELLGVPPQAAEVEVLVHTPERDFRWRGALPPSRSVDALSAVSAGPAELVITLFAGGEVLGERRLPVEIVEGAITTVKAGFLELPEVDIEDPPPGASHFLADGEAIFLRVVPRDPSLPTELSAQVLGPMESPAASGVALSLAASPLDWTGQIAVALAGPVLPATLSIRVTACRRGDLGNCYQTERAVQIHRHEWTYAAGELVRAAPLYSGTLVAAGDEAGRLHVLDPATGLPRFVPVALSGPLAGRPAAVDASLALVDGRGFLVRLAQADGRVESELDLGGGRASALFARGGTLYTAAGTRVLAAGPSGPPRELLRLPAAIRAEVLVDELGLVAADTQGNARAVDAAELPGFSARLEGAVLAPPVRDGDRTVLVDSTGLMIRVGPTGAVEELARLHAPVVHRPIRRGDEWLVAVGDRLAVIAAGGAVDFIPLGEPATAGPTLAPDYGDGAVLLGLRSGLWVVFDAAGSKRILSRVPGAALHAQALSGRRILVAGSRGDLELLRAEEAF